MLQELSSKEERNDICIIKYIGNHETSLHVLGKEMKDLYKPTRSVRGSLARSYKGEIRKTEK